MPSSPHHRRGFIGTRDRQARGHKLPGLHLARAENGTARNRFWQTDGVAGKLTQAREGRSGYDVHGSRCSPERLVEGPKGTPCEHRGSKEMSIYPPDTTPV